MTSNSLFTIAILAFVLLAPAEIAANHLASEQLRKSTADHSEFQARKPEFISDTEVTKTCLLCQTQSDEGKPNTSNRRHSTWTSE